MSVIKRWEIKIPYADKILLLKEGEVELIQWFDPGKDPGRGNFTLDQAKMDYVKSHIVSAFDEEVYKKLIAAINEMKNDGH